MCGRSMDSCFICIEGSDVLHGGRQRQSKQNRDKEVICERKDMQRGFVKDTGPVPLS